MTRNVLLDNVAHKDLRVRTGYSAEFGDSINSVLVFPTEFVHVQREYPILFRKDPSGQPRPLRCSAWTGRKPVPQGNSWNARYVPADSQRGPFLIGFRKNELGGEIVREPVIHIDLDHPRVSETEGEPIVPAPRRQFAVPRARQSHAADHLSRARPPPHPCLPPSKKQDCSRRMEIESAARRPREIPGARLPNDQRSNGWPSSMARNSNA